MTTHTSGVHTLMCVHCESNQVRGTINGPLTDSSNQVAVHVRRPGNRRMAKHLADRADIGTTRRPLRFYRGVAASSVAARSKSSQHGSDQ
jgi:hypothetical protein